MTDPAAFRDTIEGLQMPADALARLHAELDAIAAQGPGTAGSIRPFGERALELWRQANDYCGDLDDQAKRDAADDRARYRRARYEDARPPEYATADLTELLPQQDPGGRGTGWLRSGAKNALLTGPSGHGKTHLAYAIGNAALDRGMWVEAWSLLELVQALAPLPTHARRDEARSQRQENVLTWAKTCDLLILDDLGPEEGTGFVAERWRAQLLDILTARDGVKTRRTVVTINGGATADQPTDEGKAQVRRMAAAQIAERYSARAATRLQRECIGVWVEGECLRKAATWDPFE